LETVCSAEDSVLLQQVLDDVLLLSIDPAGEQQEHEGDGGGSRSIDNSVAQVHLELQWWKDDSLALHRGSRGRRPRTDGVYGDGQGSGLSRAFAHDGLRAASYPDSGDHRVLFDFYAQNQVSEGIEHLHFNSTLRVTEGESAAIVGYPVFIGLGVPPAGVAFKCLTVNVKNDEDKRFPAALESDVFKSGRRLPATLQPAIAPLAGLATALTKSVVARHRNVAVQEFYLGLDFSRVVTGARLRAGTYIAVQIPELMSSSGTGTSGCTTRAAGASLTPMTAGR
jgi:hypothetical protein